ncbi:embryo defective 1303 [Raphanus sativus]|uniref:Protein YELLOW LEAF 1, choloroplastic n=1 Tax=Raphanus sativus TaxID=3726 RepID=A0A6J0JHW7_RAPSA|nr:protein YELLOW LEAF 1, choloroplastic [Raphanus sativus]KAJ4891501.1 embryo defective 1303 [Raphanus sativus]
MAMAASILQASPLSVNINKNVRIRSSGLVVGGIKRPDRVSSLSAVGMGLGLDSRRKRSLLICNSAANAKCSESQGQTQTVIRESPTITQAPVHSKEKSPSLDDGGDGFPPRDDGDGGGGGGGGGNWSGGFFFFGFLAFLGLLKDKEGEEDYRGSRRR